MFWKAMRLNLHKVAFKNIYPTRCYCFKSVINNDLLQFFQQNFGLPEEEIEQIFKKYPSFYKDTYTTLSDNFSLLMDFGFSKNDIIKKVQVLTLHPITIKNYIMLLEEGGFIKNKIDANTLLRFKHVTNKSVKQLKNENCIGKHVDVEHSMLSFVEFPKELYPKNCDDSLPWILIQKHMFKLYVSWKINMDLESIDNAQASYCRLQNKSFRLVEKSIDTMLHKFNFSKEKIRKHSYLIHSNSDNALEILENCKYLCGVDIKLVVQKHPKIILHSMKSISQIKKHFEEFGIPESALSKQPQIFTLGSKTVYNRLCKIKETPELASLINNPQIARLVYYYNKAASRLKYLQSKNCVSLNLLVTSDSLFNRFHCNGNNKGKTNDAMIYLVSQLGEDKQKLRTLLERHPYWQYISLLSIRKTYEFLKNKKFSKKQLCHCLHILLYPIHSIEEALITTQNMKNVSYLRDSSGSIKPAHLLSLVLYNLEKNHHFSGDGVWSSNPHIKKLSSPNSSKDMYEDREELDHEPLTKLM